MLIKIYTYVTIKKKNEILNYKMKDSEIYDLLKNVFLDEKITSFVRDVRLMRIFQFHLEDEMSIDRKNQQGYLPKKYLNPDGSLTKEYKYSVENKE